MCIFAIVVLLLTSGPDSDPAGLEVHDMTTFDYWLTGQSGLTLQGVIM